MTHLLKKELSELFNKQMLISLAVSFFIIVILGVLMTTTVSGEIADTGTVRIIDCDDTAFTHDVAAYLEEQGYTVLTGTDFAQEADAHHWTDAVLFPAGMTEALLERHESCTIESYSVLRSTSTVAMTIGGTGAQTVSDAIQAVLSAEYLTGDLAFLEDPVNTVPYTRANGITVQADSAAVVSSLAMFDMLMPLVLFLLVVLTAQTIITAIAAEKTDKTLETLLSAPVPRTTIIGAKMLAALIVAGTYAAVYGLGFAASMLMTVSNGVEMSGMDVGAAFTDLVNTRTAIETLGLEIPAYGWLGVLMQLALTLGIALTAAIILGAMVQDAKNAQSASLPIMLCTMFPYILSMVSDIRNLDSGMRMLLYAIPFTHTFTATSCLRFHDYPLFWGGMVYQAVFLAALLFLAVRLYNSDVLFIGLRKRSRKEQDA
ncbi:MAG: ABC transporter permease [Oscillospiraceae bacterium]|nr:ABC transporter permease [Oscillospiraceae bacterium]